MFVNVLILCQGHCIALVQAVSDVQEQGAVDDRDTFLHGVRDLLSIHSSKEKKICLQLISLSLSLEER